MDESIAKETQRQCDCPGCMTRLHNGRGMDGWVESRTQTSWIYQVVDEELE